MKFDNYDGDLYLKCNAQATPQKKLSKLNLAHVDA